MSFKFNIRKLVVAVLPKKLKPFAVQCYLRMVRIKEGMIISKIKKMIIKYFKELPYVTGDLSLISSFHDKANSKSILIFPVIDWHFRVQRPQHLARELAANNKVVYLTTQFNFSVRPGFVIKESPVDNVIICQLNFNKVNRSIYKDSLTEKEVIFLLKGIDALRRTFNLGETHSIVNLPFWTDLVEKMQNNFVTYDCMDHHAGFENNEEGMLEKEKQLLKSSDLVITSAARLSEIISKDRENTIIRNAADVEYFSKVNNADVYQKTKPIVGYYGAIAEWFDLDLLIKTAQRLPDYEFLMIGAVTCDISKAKSISNIKFIGEVKYTELTAYLKYFDVCLIPFKLIELTLCTNPVKVYEYLAAGKPVITTAMPELIEIQDYVHVAHNSDDFVGLIEKGMNEKDDEELASMRRSWAKTQDWKSRARDLETYLVKLQENLPKVSIVILTYNNLDLTKNCLRSIERNTQYSNYEVIIVDNLSTDGSRDFLSDYVKDKHNYSLILNDENKGFSAGNNDGLKAAKGDVLVILNNDTYVSPGWLGSLVSAFKKNDNLGLVGPVTNNIGNEAKINISYDNWSSMVIESDKYKYNNIGKTYKMDCAAFFCVAFTREVFEKVGLMDENFGIGFFEDDDYCMRVRNAGWEIAAIEDSFVHHHLSASFNKLKSGLKEKLFKENKAKFEAKWGTWKPHSYR